MPTQQTLARVESYWTARLGCSALGLHRPRVTLLRIGGTFAAYRGVFLLRWGDACVFCVPAALLAPAAAGIHGRAVDEVFDAAFLASVFASHLDRSIGPAFQGCADASDFRPVATHSPRPLTAGDGAALERLAQACGPEDWANAGIEQDLPDPAFGCFAGTELVAAGTLRLWEPGLRNVHIVTHPTYRGRGYGRAVVSALTAHALAQGHVAQYQTLLSNAGSLAIARALGFQQYASTIAVRLRDID